MKKIIPFIFCLTAGLYSFEQTIKQYKDQAKRLISQAKYKEAFVLYEKAATQGDPEAEFILSQLYKNGVGVAANDSLRYHWCLLAARQQYPEAQEEMSMLTAYKPDNHKESFEWTKKCAETGFPPCMQTLAVYYMDGVGVEKNPDSMLIWTERQALSPRVSFDRDHGATIASARLKLATLYYKDDNIKQDLFKSYVWLLLFNEEFKDQTGMWERDKAIEIVEKVEIALNAQQKAAAEKEAAQLLKKPLRNLSNLKTIY
ncbi:hypothetical protein A3860_37845 [Niastella vici]|uniref:Sel1 repeat family protein n=1 Tax=Niastella vici TaxID=1703345 RepID=A0A1V9FM47_9BACT|nr:tetratricopeptide repeat protein [Niastella vici]OQP59423.1 hypothetical protein A3860_37845 [Niastella vici]